MKHFARFLLIVPLMLVLTAKAGAQTSPVSPQPPSATITVRDDAPKIARPDAGRVSGSTYTNEYFGLQLTIPQGWTVHNEETNKKIMEDGKEHVKADNAAHQAQLDASVQRTLSLLTITSKPTLAASNSAFQCMAERLPVAMTARDYVSSLKSLLVKTEKVAEVERDIYTETIDGVEFAAILIVMNHPAGALKQKYYVTIKKGFALGFINSNADNEGAAALDRVIQSIRLTPPTAQ